MKSGRSPAPASQGRSTHKTELARSADKSAKSTAARKDVQATQLNRDRSRSSALGADDEWRHRPASGNTQETGTAKTGADMTDAVAPASSRLVSSPQPAGTQAPPVDTLKRGRGRPASGVDRKEQKRLAEAKRRQRMREGK
jgi:hypothetical protein